MNRNPELSASALNDQFAQMLKLARQDGKDKKKKDKKKKGKKRHRKDKDSSADESSEEENEKSVQELTETLLKKHKLNGAYDDSKPLPGESRVERYARRSKNMAHLQEQRRVMSEKFTTLNMREQFELLNKISDAVNDVIYTCEDLELDQEYDFPEQVKVRLAVLSTIVKTQTRTLTMASEIGWQQAKVISTTTPAGLSLNKDQNALYSEARKERIKEKKEKEARARGRGQPFRNFSNGYSNFNRGRGRGGGRGGAPFRGGHAGPGRGFRGGRGGPNQQQFNDPNAQGNQQIPG